MRKCGTAEKVEFTLAQIGHRVEPLEFGIDLARMAHDQSAVRHAVEECRKQSRVVGTRMKCISPGKGRIGANVLAFGEAAEGTAVTVEHQRLEVGETATSLRPFALTHPGVWRCRFGHAQECIAYLRKNVHM